MSNAVTPAMAGPGFADPTGPFHPSALSSRTRFSDLLMILIGLERPGQLASSLASLPPAAGMGGPHHGSGMRVPAPQHPGRPSGDADAGWRVQEPCSAAQPDQLRELHFWGTGPICPSRATFHVGSTQPWPPHSPARHHPPQHNRAPNIHLPSPSPCPSTDVGGTSNPCHFCN